MKRQTQPQINQLLLADAVIHKIDKRVLKEAFCVYLLYFKHIVVEFAVTLISFISEPEVSMQRCVFGGILRQCLLFWFEYF